MKSVKIAILLVLVAVLLSSMPLSSVAVDEVHRVWRVASEGIEVSVYAPYEAYPGDRITVSVRVDALEELNDTDVTLLIKGSKSQGRDSWTSRRDVFEDFDLPDGASRTREYDVIVPSDLDPGLIYGHIAIRWNISLVGHLYEDAFNLVYVRNKDYEDLQAAYEDLSSLYEEKVAEYDGLLEDYNGLKSDYNSLKADYENVEAERDDWKAKYGSLETSYNDLTNEYNVLDSTYNSLLADYDDLKSKYDVGMGELSSARTLNYVLGITTIAFIATSAYLLAIRRRISEGEASVNENRIA